MSPQNSVNVHKNIKAKTKKYIKTFLKKSDEIPLSLVFREEFRDQPTHSVFLNTFPIATEF